MEWKMTLLNERIKGREEGHRAGFTEASLPLITIIKTKVQKGADLAETAGKGSLSAMKTSSCLSTADSTMQTRPCLFMIFCITADKTILSPGQGDLEKP